MTVNVNDRIEVTDSRMSDLACKLMGTPSPFKNGERGTVVQIIPEGIFVEFDTPRPEGYTGFIFVAMGDFKRIPSLKLVK